MLRVSLDFTTAPAGDSIRTAGRFVVCGFSVVMLATTGCRTEAFSCQTDDGCRLETLQGFCEPSGYCSFPDEDCDSGWRYGENGPSAIAGECVGGR